MRNWGVCWIGLVMAVGALLVPTPSAQASAGPEVPSPPGLDRAQQSIREREYWPSDDGHGVQAPNRAHDLRTYFGERGIRVHSRTAAASGPLIEMQWLGMGRESHLVPVGPGVVHRDASRVEIRRPGLTEWFVNSPAGLEQGFTLEDRPSGEGALRVEIQVRRARAAMSRENVRLRTDAGRSLDYAKLHVVDANGTAIDSHFEVPEPSRIHLVVADGEAAYPLTIDPLLTASADAQLESDQQEAHLGWSVAGAGDVNGDGFGDVIVGAPFYDSGELNEGAVFIFHGSSTGLVGTNPSNAATSIESNQASANFGASVASAGDINGDGYADVIIGAQSYDDGEADEGAAFIFLGGATGVVGGGVTAAHAQLESNQVSAFFGLDVSSAGDVNGDGFADVIVGSRLYDLGEADEGAAFVFFGGASGIADGDPTTADAILQSNQIDGYLGAPVDAAGDVNGDGFSDIIVGATGYDSGVNDAAAFVFLGSASGVVGDSPANAHAEIGTVILIGFQATAAGDLNGDGYSDVLTISSNSVAVHFGSPAGIASGGPVTLNGLVNPWQLASAGDVNGDGYSDVVVSEFGGDSVLVYRGGPAGFSSPTPFATLASGSGSGSSSQFGASVAAAGDVDGDGYADVLVGAANFAAGDFLEGAAFLYLGGAAGIVGADIASYGPRIESNQADAELGWSVASAGDVNGDGYSDVIVGAEDYDAGVFKEGAAFIFHGGSGGILIGSPFMADTELRSGQFASQFGRSVSSAGDVNGDGFSDVVVGAPNYDAGQSNEGALFVFLGSASGVASGEVSTAHATIESDYASSGFGRNVTSAGDVNGDGYADIAAGAAFYEAGQVHNGAVFVFQGSASGITATSATDADTHIEANQSTSWFGDAVSAADVNGDGFSDLMIGVSDYDGGGVVDGALLVFHGGPTGIDSGPSGEADTQVLAGISGGSYFVAFGTAVSGAGDVNGDGFEDVMVSGFAYETEVVVFHGSAAGITALDTSDADTLIKANEIGTALGREMAAAGDVNGDGYGDVILAASSIDPGGAAFVYLGSATGIDDGDLTTGIRIDSSNSNDVLGASVASAGDVNGDGFSDVIVGAPRFDGGQNNEGAAFLFYGDGQTLVAPPLQLRQLGLAGGPIAEGGRADSPDLFQVQMFGSHPSGRGGVKLEVEVCPVGTNFGGGACEMFTSAWTGTTATFGGVLLTAFVPFPPTATLARWRARVLRVPYAVPLWGVTPPPNPSHGPWRHLAGAVDGGDVRRQLDSVSSVPSGLGVVGDVLGGPPATGGVDLTFADATAGDLSGQFTPVPLGPGLTSLLDDPGDVDFLMFSNPVQFWEVSFDGTLNGPIAMTFQYDDTQLLVPESDLAVYHYTTDWEALPILAHDTVANTITVETSSLSPFVLGGAPQASAELSITGTAAGGSVDLLVGGVFLSVATTAAQTDAQVAAAIAAAVNADAILMAAGVVASADGASVDISAPVAVTDADSGLSIQVMGPPEVPSLAVWNALGLLAALTGVAAMALRAAGRRAS